tara:strand:- start:2010 stop:2849 length:840 start_codon:yes stop_codon:yes gene_type:complete
VPAPRPRRISEYLPRMQNVAQSSHYLVKFALPISDLRSYLRRKGINDRFVAEDAGLLVSDAVLPGSAMAAVNVAGDFQGVIERFAHTRNFTQINLEFYVDNDYTSLKFIEHWMEYITGAIPDPANDSYHFQLNYPSEYKSNETRIVKFERDYNRFLEYKFIGLFPLSLNSTRVSYQGSQVLKASVAFSYDRYICGESTSLIRDLLKAYNNIFGRGNTYDANSGKLSSITNGQLNQLYGNQQGIMNNSGNVQIMTSGITGTVNPPNVAGQALGGSGLTIS